MRCAIAVLIPFVLLMLSLATPPKGAYAQQGATSPSDLVATDTEAADAAPTYPLQYVPLDNYKLEKWGTRAYTMYGFPTRKRGYQEVVVHTRERVRVGTVTLKTEVEENRVIMEDYWADPAQEQGWAYLTFHCKRDNLLTMQQLIYQQGMNVSHCDVTDGTYELDRFQRRRSGEWPEGTVTEASLLRIFTMLPRVKGVSFSIDHYTVTPELSPVSTKGEAIVCHGPETLKIKKVNMECTKFTFRDMQAWVRNVDDTLVRFYVPGMRELVIKEEPREFAKVLREAAAEE